MWLNGNDSKYGRVYKKPKKADLGLKIPDIRSERVISTKERADLGLHSG